MNDDKNRFSFLKAGGLVASVLAFAIDPLFAIEPPPDEAEPPAALQQDRRAPLAVPQIEQVDVPFVGIATASLPGMVADHLGIEAGNGVIVRTVLTDSPADQAGLKVNDIILEVNEASVGHPEEFSSAIRGFKIGDVLDLNIIHKGKPAELKLTLAARPAGQVAGFDQQPMLEGLPEAHAERLRDLIERNLNAFGQDGLENLAIPDGHFDETFKRLRERMKQGFDLVPEIHPEQDRGIQLEHSSTVRVMDQEGSVEIISNGQSTEVIVRDADNQIQWSGPWITEQDKAAVPESIRKRIEQVHSSTGKSFSLRFGKLKPAPQGN